MTKMLRDNFRMMRKWFVASFVICVLFLPSLAPAEITVRSDHPRIWITKDNIAEIRERNLSGSMKPYWETYKSRKLDGKDVNVYNVAHFALGYLITSNIEYANKVINFLKTGDLGSLRIEWSLIAFDWVYNAMSENDRDTIIKRLTAGWNADSYPHNPEDSVPFGEGTFVNWGWHNTQFKGIIFWGHHPAAGKALACAEAQWLDALKVMENIFPDGEYWEGFGYLRHTMPYAVLQMEAIKTATGIDHFKNSKAFRNHPYFIMYGIRPDDTCSRLDDMWVPENAGQFRSTLLILHHEYKDPYLQWYLNHWAPLDHPNNTGLFDIIYYDPSAPEQNLSNLPLAKHFKGWGVVYMRSGWNKGTYEAPPGDTFIEFKCGDFYSYHNQYASNTFNVYHKGALVAESLGYGEPGSTNRTVVHNTMLIYNSKEVFPNKAENDGGQRIVQWEVNRPHTYREWVDNPRKWEAGDIKKFEAIDEYVYLLGDATAAYNKNKLNKFEREFVFLQPNYIVVFDRVDTTRADFQKSWLLHSLKTPVLYQDSQEIIPPAGINSYDSKLVRIDRGDNLTGRLFIKTLLPSQSQIKVIGGPGYEIWFAGSNHQRIRRDKYEELADWRIEVQPQIPSKDDLFLHILYLTNISANSMPQAKLIQSKDNQMAGAQIENRLALFSKTGKNISKVDYSIVYKGSIRHLICNLEPNREYSVIDNEKFLKKVTSSAQGVLYFVIEGDGEQRISITEVIANE